MRRILFFIIFISLTADAFAVAVAGKTLTYWSETMEFGTPAQKLDVLKQIRRTDNKAVLAILIKALSEEIDEKVRKEIIQILYEKKEPRALNPLLKNLKTATNPQLIATTLAAIGQLKDKRAVNSITNFLNHENTEVIQAAIRALGKIEAPSVGPRLLTMLTNSKTDKELVYPLLNTLGGIRYKPAFAAIRKIAINSTRPQFMRAFAITALGRLGDMRALDDLLNLLKQEKFVRLRIRVIGALGAMKSPRAIEVLRIAMRDRDSSVRSAAVKAAGKLKSKKLVPVLMYKLKYDTAPEVMVSAAEALYELGEQGILPTVLKKFEASTSVPVLDRLLKLFDKADYRKAAATMRKKQQEHKIKRSSIKYTIEAILKKWGKAGKTEEPSKKSTRTRSKKKKTVKKKGRIYLR